MRIALFGATGAVGGHFLNKALAAGHEVAALVRTPEKLSEHTNLSALRGDVTSPSDVAKVILGADVVVSCLGNVKGVLIMKKRLRQFCKPPLNKQTRQNACLSAASGVAVRLGSSNRCCK